MLSGAVRYGGYGVVPDPPCFMTPDVVSGVDDLAHQLGGDTSPWLR